MAIDQFFNKSSFKIQTLETQPSISPNTNFVVHLYVYDVLSMYGADSFTATYYTGAGRNKSEINSSTWTYTKVGTHLWKVEGSIPSSVWDGNTTVEGVATIGVTLTDGTTATIQQPFELYKGA